jgi:hypothetical protein
VWWVIWGYDAVRKIFFYLGLSYKKTYIIPFFKIFFPEKIDKKKEGSPFLKFFSQKKSTKKKEGTLFLKIFFSEKIVFILEPNICILLQSF